MACKAGICESETVFLWAHMSMPACVSLRSSTRSEFSSPLMLGSCQTCTPCKGRPSHSHQSGTWVHVMLFYYLDAVIEDNLRRAIGYGRRMPGKRPPCSARAVLCNLGSSSKELSHTMVCGWTMRCARFTATSPACVRSASTDSAICTFVFSALL